MPKSSHPARAEVTPATTVSSAPSTKPQAVPVINHVQKCTHKRSCAVPAHCEWSILSPQNPCHMWCVPTMAHTLGWSIFYSHLLMLWCLGRASAVQVEMAVVTRDRRGHSLAFISDSLLLPTLGVTHVECLHGEGRERWKHKGFHQHLLKESHFGQRSHFWEQLAWLERRKKNTQKRNESITQKDFFPLFILSVRASDVLQMGQDLIFPPYTKVSARSCCSSCLD